LAVINYAAKNFLLCDFWCPRAYIFVECITKGGTSGS